MSQSDVMPVALARLRCPHWQPPQTQPVACTASHVVGEKASQLKPEQATAQSSVAGVASLPIDLMRLTSCLRRFLNSASVVAAVTAHAQTKHFVGSMVAGRATCRRASAVLFDASSGAARELVRRGAGTSCMFTGRIGSWAAASDSSSGAARELVRRGAGTSCTFNDVSVAGELTCLLLALYSPRTLYRRVGVRGMARFLARGSDS